MTVRFRDDRKARRQWGRALALALAWTTLAGCDASAPDPAMVAPDVPAVVPHARQDAHTRRRRAAARERVGQGGPIRIALVGDSITEGWRRSGRGVFERGLAPYGAINLGVDGDRTEHVLGRIQEGDLDGIAPALCVLLIGTNNLARDPPGTVVAGIGAVVEALRQARPEAEILLLALLPRGKQREGRARRVVDETNRRLAAAARDWPVTFLDVGTVLLEADGTLAPAVSPDALHLSAEGYARLEAALRPEIERVLGPLEPGTSSRPGL